MGGVVSISETMKQAGAFVFRDRRGGRSLLVLTSGCGGGAGLVPVLIFSVVVPSDVVGWRETSRFGVGLSRSSQHKSRKLRENRASVTGTKSGATNGRSGALTILDLGQGQPGWIVIRLHLDRAKRQPKPLKPDVSTIGPVHRNASDRR